MKILLIICSLLLSVVQAQAGFWEQLGVQNVVSSGASALDDFERVNGPLGTNWTTVVGAQAPTIYSGQTGSGSSADYMAFWNTDTFSNDHCSYVIKTNTFAYGGPAVRVNPTNDVKTMYYARLHTTNPGQLYKAVSGVVTPIGSSFAEPTWTSGEEIKLCAVGTTLSLYIDDSLLHSETDESISSGQPGFMAYGITTLFSDWGAYDN